MIESDIIRLWEHPSFEPSFNWLISTNRQQHTYCLRQTESSIPYRQLVEKKWFESAKYLIYKEAPLDYIELMNWMDECAKILVPILNVEHVSGYDGISYGFEYTDYLTRFKAEWWEDGPKEWKPLIDWYHEFVKWLKSELDNAQTS